MRYLFSAIKLAAKHNTQWCLRVKKHGQKKMKNAFRRQFNSVSIHIRSWEHNAPSPLVRWEMPISTKAIDSNMKSYMGITQ